MEGELQTYKYFLIHNSQITSITSITVKNDQMFVGIMLGAQIAYGALCG